MAGLGPGATGASAQETLAQVTAAQFSMASIVFYPGVFRVHEPEHMVEDLCLPSAGRWLRAGNDDAGCQIDPTTGKPPPERRYQLGAAPDGMSWIVSNLGLTTAEWRQAQQAAAPDGSYKQAVAAAARLYADGGGGPDAAVHWVFNSALLPPQLDAEIPGSGIFMHMQDRLARAAPLFSGADQSVLIEAKLGLPQTRIDGDATAIVTLTVGMQVPDATGHPQPLGLIIGLFNSRGYVEHDRVGTDGRNAYVATSLLGSPRFVAPVTAGAELKPGGGAQVFAFRLTPATLTAMITALNGTRAERDLPPLRTDPAGVLLKQLAISTENGFLDKGHVLVGLDAEYIRAVRETP